MGDALVAVIGGGISGMGLAVALQKRALTPPQIPRRRGIGI